MPSILLLLLCAIAHAGPPPVLAVACPTNVLARDKEALQSGLAPEAALETGIRPAIKDPRGAPLPITREFTERTGIAEIRSVGVLGRGGQSVVELVEVTDTAGNVRERALNKALSTAANPPAAVKEHEKVGAMYAEEKRPESEQYVVPILEKVPTGAFRGKGEGLLMPLAGESWEVVRRQPNVMTPRDASGAFTGSAADHALVGQRTSRLIHDGCRGIEDLRKAKVVHRDLKASNFVLFGGEENTLAAFDAGKSHAAVLDFGIAVPEGASVDGKMFFGSRGLMEPTGYRKVLSASSASDVFQLASVAAEDMLGYPIQLLVKKMPKAVTNGVEGIVQTVHLSREGVLAELGELRKYKESQGASALELAQHDEITRFIDHGLIADIDERRAAFNADPQSPIKFDR